MKNTFIFLAVLLFTAALACGQSISVIAPNGGESWTLGTPQGITWSSQGCTGNVRINLVKAGGGAFGTIAVVPVASGSYSWTVGQTNSGPAPAGDYRIGLYVPTQDVDGQSDGVFKIMTVTAPPDPRKPPLAVEVPAKPLPIPKTPVRTDARITVTKPSSSRRWTKGTTHAVEWETNFPQNSFTVDLYDARGENRIAGIFQGTVTPFEPGKYRTHWKIPLEVAEGSYRIRVLSQNTIKDLSATIFIAEPGQHNWQEKVMVLRPTDIRHGGIPLHCLQGKMREDQLLVGTVFADGGYWNVKAYLYFYFLPLEQEIKKIGGYILEAELELVRGSTALPSDYNPNNCISAARKLYVLTGPWTDSAVIPGYVYKEIPDVNRPRVDVRQQVISWISRQEVNRGFIIEGGNCPPSSGGQFNTIYTPKLKIKYRVRSD